MLDDLHTVTDPECLASIDHALEHLPANAPHGRRARAWIRRCGSRGCGPAASSRRCARASSRSPSRRRASCSSSAVTSTSARRRSSCSSSAPRAGRPRSFSPGSGCGPSTTPHRAVRDFGGDQRFVADYLSSEVLRVTRRRQRSVPPGRLGPRTVHRGALRRRARPLRLGAPCWPSSSARTCWSSPLERGGWFRVHSLFAEYATAELASLDPGAGTRIHRRAAGWLRSHGLPIEATEHAAAAGDHELVAELLVEYHLPLIRSGASRTLLRWVRDAAGRASSSSIRSSRPPRRRPRCWSVRARWSCDASCRSSTERGPGAPRDRTGTSTRRRTWCARSRSTAASAGGPRRPTCRRARAGGRGRAPHRRSRRLCPRALLRRRPRRRVERPRCGSSSIRTPRRRVPEPGARPHDARPRRGRARAALRRPPPRREGEGDRRRDRDQPELARRERLGRPRRRAGGRGQARGGGARARRRRSTSSRTRWRPCTTPGCASFSPVSACAAAAWTRRSRPCAAARRSSTS